MIENAVQFLRNPNVAGTPLARRIAFMKRKGMTSQEIDEALRRAGPVVESAVNVTPALPPRQANAYGQPPPLPLQYAPQQQQGGHGWGAIAAASLLAVGVGIGMSYLVESYVLPWWRGTPKPKSKPKEAEEGDEKNVKEVLADVSQNQREVIRTLAELTQTLRDSKK
jgi:peroxin-14